MGCIIAASGSKTLCNKSCSVVDVREFFATEQKITCLECLIRQDAMFERGYKQDKYAVWYVPTDGSWLSYKYGYYQLWGTSRISIPRKSKFTTAVMWDNKTIKGAIKLGKLGVHGMGLAK